MRITINLKKSIEQNAAEYFEKAKKLRKKIAGARKITEEQRKKLNELLKKKSAEIEREKQREEYLRTKKQRKAERAWYEKFHWFFTSEGFLVIGGKDATTNEIVVKKHVENDDLVFHTDEPGSPFVVLKCKGKCGQVSINEAAQECAVYSRAWKRGFSPSVFYVGPEQVTKEAKSGEFVPRGAFMIYGQRNYVREFGMQIAIGITKEGKIIGGPVTAVEKQSEKYEIVNPGDTKKTDLAKKIQKKIGGELDDIAGFLPGDGSLST
jgi:predicted ribosome quality control (RQC) complex YloA/Tae2 family protein